MNESQFEVDVYSLVQHTDAALAAYRESGLPEVRVLERKLRKKAARIDSKPSEGMVWDR